MPRIEPGREAELLLALKDLHRSMGRLSGFAAGAMGCSLVLETWVWLRGSGLLMQALAAAVLAAALLAAGLSWAARRRIRRWTRAVDARLGPGTGRALLELGSFQEGAFELEDARHGMPSGGRPKKG